MVYEQNERKKVSDNMNDPPPNPRQEKQKNKTTLA